MFVEWGRPGWGSITKPAGYGRLPFDIPYDAPQKGYKVLAMIDGAVCSVLDRAFHKKVTTRNWKTIERCYQAMQADAEGLTL